MEIKPAHQKAPSKFSMKKLYGNNGGLKRLPPQERAHRERRDKGISRLRCNLSPSGKDEREIRAKPIYIF